MSRKVIKSLEVSDFRGLHGSRVLDFEGADIILLLGLNGFGKTSVFDSIEWCLTGKLGRYEKYTETGRKQDFSKEKEVLRNKYSSNPDTYVKVHLENEAVFGRGVCLDKGASDYNMGKSLDGCEYGLDSITSEVMNEKLINSYFSATHILSQETINHFVTSKKPEDRYQALSVNFGTAVFSPFEGNSQLLLSRVQDKEKALLQLSESKGEVLSTLRKQIQTDEGVAQKMVADANEVILKINELGLMKEIESVNFVDSKIVYSDGVVVFLEESKSSYSLQYSELQAVLKELKYLKDGYDTWREVNKKAERSEEDITILKNVEVEVLQRANTINELKLKSSREVKEVNTLDGKISILKNVISDIPKFSESLRQVASIEEQIKMLSLKLSKEEALSIKYEADLAEMASQRDSLDVELLKIKSVFGLLEENERLIADYDSNRSIKRELIERKTIELTSSKEAIVKIRNDISLLNSIDRAEGYRPILIGLQSVKGAEDESLNSLFDLLDSYDELQIEIRTARQLERDIISDRERILSRFSDLKSVLSGALDQLLPGVDKQPCPVCDVDHDSSNLISKIEKKLGKGENELLTEVNLKLSDVNRSIDDLEKRLGTVTDKVEEGAKSLLSHFSNILKEHTLEELKLIEFIKVVTDELEALGASYNRIFGAVSSLVDLDPLKIDDAKERLITIIDGRVTALSKFDGETDLVSSSLKGCKKNTSDLKQEKIQLLSDLDVIRDYRYTEVLGFLKEYGVSATEEGLQNRLQADLEALELSVSKYNREIAAAAGHILENENSIKELLGEREILDLKKDIVRLESLLSSQRAIILDYSHRLSVADIPVADYNVQNISEKLALVTKKVEILEKVTSYFDRILHLLDGFGSYNSNDATRKKVIEVESEVLELKKNLGVLKKAKKKVDVLKKSYPSVMRDLITENLDIELFNQIYSTLNPHRRFKDIDFNVDVSRNKIGLNFSAKHSNITARPEFLFSSAQLNTFGICMFLSMSLRQSWLDLDTILIDDPIQNLDDINILSFIDFLRTHLDSETNKKQIILSTHDERFYDLMLRKFSDYNLKSYRFESYGQIVPDASFS